MTNESRQFAKDMLEAGMHFKPPGLLRITERWTELVLWREGQQQVELIILNPGVAVPAHKHARCESTDVCLAGTGAFRIGARSFDFTGRDFEIGRRLFDVPRNAPHGGSSGPTGAAYLSFQVWDGEPDYIADDWLPC